jgi:hypothetical protein
MSSFPAGFRIEGKFIDKWARVGNSVPPLFMRAIAGFIRSNLLDVLTGSATCRLSDPYSLSGNYFKGLPNRYYNRNSETE